MRPASDVAVAIAMGLMLGGHSTAADAGTHRSHRPHAQHAHRAAHVYNDSNYAAHDYSGRGTRSKSFVPRPRTKPPVQPDY